VFPVRCVIAMICGKWISERVHTVSKVIQYISTNKAIGYI